MIDLSTILDGLDTLPRPALAERYRDLSSVCRDLESLSRHQGWKHLQQLLADNSAVVQNERPTGWYTSSEDVYKDQYMKGCAEGLRRPAAILAASLEAFQNARDQIAAFLEQENEDGSSSDRADTDASDAEPRTSFAP